tara:strand:- start:53 stop:361 length:309 start_codon:yes stop_codon:yes gene_type:complete
MLDVLQLTNSPRAKKRFRILIKEGDIERSFDFGLQDGQTYTDNGDKAKRDAYRKRHYANKKEKELIDNLIPSPALFSYYLLWGDSQNITENIIALEKLVNRT